MPRGNQRYPYDYVQKEAQGLRDGMTKFQVMMLLGSPAEKDENDDEWIYLPERYGILVPAHALRLKFEDGLLVEHGHQAIVLGARL